MASALWALNPSLYERPKLKTVMNKRILGLDLARAMAVIGMIIVNFKVLLGEQGPEWLKNKAAP